MKFTLDGTILNFTISNYRRSTLAGWKDEWCDVELKVSSRYVNYENSGKLMLCSEVESLFGRLCDLNDGKVTRREHIFLAEPVLEFRLRPAVETDDGSADVDMYFCINLNDDEDVVTANSISLLFDRENIEKLRKYLKVTIASVIMEEKVKCEFEYYIGYGNGNYSRVRTYEQEITKNEVELINKGVSEGKHLSEMDGLHELYRRLEKQIKIIEGDNLRDAEIWTEEYFNEYGTDDPFSVFELIIDVKDR